MKTGTYTRVPVLHGWLSLLFLLPLNTVAQQKELPRKCIMVFGAHADDADEIAGGTLAKYVAMGYEGVYVCAINNLDGCNLETTPWFDMKNKVPKSESTPALAGFTALQSPHPYPVGALETSQIREEEARQAAAVYPATAVFLNFKEPTMFLGRHRINYDQEEYHHYDPPGRPLISLACHMDEQVDVVVDLLRKYKPEIVITHTLGGEKLDHGNAAYLMYLAFVRAMDENIAVGKLWMVVNGWLHDEPARSNGRGQPDIHIDVRKYLKIKYEALNKHISQNGGFGRDYVLGNDTQAGEVTEDFITVIDNTK